MEDHDYDLQFSSVSRARTTLSRKNELKKSTKSASALSKRLKPGYNPHINNTPNYDEYGGVKGHVDSGKSTGKMGGRKRGKNKGRKVERLRNEVDRTKTFSNEMMATTTTEGSFGGMNGGRASPTTHDTKGINNSYNNNIIITEPPPTTSSSSMPDQVKSLYDQAHAVTGMTKARKKLKKTGRRKLTNKLPGTNHSRLRSTAGPNNTGGISGPRGDTLDLTPSDLTSAELKVVKWIVLRETYLERLGAVSTSEYR